MIDSHARPAVFAERHGGETSFLGAFQGRAAIAALVLSVAVILGGGGAPSPLVELIVELATLLAILIWQAVPPAEPRAGADHKLQAWIAAFFVLVTLQMVPLPPAIWHRLPGRDVELQALSLVGAAGTWRALSVWPDHGLTVLLGAIPPAFMAVGVSRLSVDARTMLLLVLVGLCCIATFVGVLQVINGGPAWLTFYPNTAGGFGTGLNANRNSSADLLLTGILALGAVVAVNRHRLDGWAARTCVVTTLLYLLAGIALTGSRTGILLTPVALACVVLMIWPGLRVSARSAALVAVALVGIAGGGYALRDNPVLQRTFGRFHLTREGRTEDLWPDALHAARTYWPVGAGFGTFVPVFQIAERLDVVGPALPNRAHNDFIELTIEAGLAGLALFAAAGGALLLRVRRLLVTARSDVRRPQVFFAVGIATVLACHSVVDYPMRCLSLSTIAGLGIGMIAMPTNRRAARAIHGKVPS